MALIKVDFFSEVLGMGSQVNVLLPQEKQGIGIEGTKKSGSYPVLWLLHGASDDHTTWMRRTSIERYVASMGIAVITPAAHLSFYTNMKYGAPYLDYIADELPEIMGGFFPISHKREDNFIAGQSMGGYGALKIGLSRPGRYAGIGCFSSGNLVLDINRTKMPDLDKINEMVYGVQKPGQLLGTEHDIFELAKRYISSGQALPAIYQVCGSEDFLIEFSRKTNDWFQNSAFDFIYKEAQGEHDWDFWDVWIQDFLSWMRAKLTAKS